MVEIEWPTTITDEMYNDVVNYVENKDNSSKPIQVRLREACGTIIMRGPKKMLNQFSHYLDNDIQILIAQKLTAYHCMGIIFLSPVGNAHVQLSYVDKNNERELGKAGMELFLLTDDLNQILSRDSTGLELAEHYKNEAVSYSEPWAEGIIAATRRYKQLYNRFAELFEV